MSSEEAVAGSTLAVVPSPEKSEKTAVVALPVCSTLEVSRRNVQASDFALMVMGDKVQPLLEEKCVQRIAEYMYTTWAFQMCYNGCQQYLDGKDADGVVECVAGQQLPDLTRSKSLRTVGEMLHKKITGNARAFCGAFCALQDFLEKDGLCDARTLMEMHEIELDDGKDTPIPPDELETAMKFKRIKASASALQIPDQTEALSLAEVFFHNISRQQGEGNKAEEYSTLIMQEREKISETMKRIAEHTLQAAGFEATITNCQESMKRLSRERLEAALLEKNIFHDNARERLLKDLERAKTAKYLVEKDEKTYTFRMYGVGSYIWANDVALAKEKIKRYTDEIEHLNSRLSLVESAKTADNVGNDTHDATLMKTLVEDRAQVNVKMQEAGGKLKNVKAELDTCMKTLVCCERKVAMAEKRLATLVKRAGKISPEHLINSLEAKSTLANVANRTNDVDENFNHMWRGDLESLKVLMAKTIAATSFTKQKKMFELLEKQVASDKKIVFNVLKASKPILSLTVGDGAKINRSVVRESKLPSTSENISEIELLTIMVDEDRKDATDVPPLLVQSMAELEQALERPDKDAGSSEHLALAKICLEKANKDVKRRRELIQTCRSALNENGTDRLELAVKACQEARRGDDDDGFQDYSNKISLCKSAETEIDRRLEAHRELRDALDNVEDDKGFETLCQMYAKHKLVKIDAIFKNTIRSKIKEFSETKKVISFTLPKIKESSETKQVITDNAEGQTISSDNAEGQTISSDNAEGQTIPQGGDVAVANEGNREEVNETLVESLLLEDDYIPEEW